MGLLGELYNAFGLGYTIALAILKNDDLKPIDIAFLAATGAFMGLSLVLFCNQCRHVPAGYQCTFFWKSLGRGLCAPVLWLFHYRILFFCSKCFKRCLTFSNEAYDGVERTRQLVIFELEGRDNTRSVHNLATHNLLRFEDRTWGYDRRVGDIWVRLSFAVENESTVHCLKLQTKDDGTTSLLQCRHDVASKQSNPGTSSQEVIGGGQSGDLESGLLPSTYRTTLTIADPYPVKITRRWERCRIQQIECCPGCCPGRTSNLERTEDIDKKWTLSQMHQYMLCLDAWGNYPKQGIWRLPVKDGDQEKKPCCPDCTYWCNFCSGNQKRKENFRYCYRHDELIDAIGEGKRLRQTPNKGIWFTVV